MSLSNPVWFSRRRSAARNRLALAGVWAGLLIMAAVVGIMASRWTYLFIAASGSLLVAALVTFAVDRPQRWHNHGWIPFAWVVVLVLPSFRFTLGDPRDTSVSSLTVENAVQLLAYALVAIAVLHSRALLVAERPLRIVKGPLLAWPIVAVLSTLWSPIPVFTLVRSAQLWVPIGLALLMARVWVIAPDRAHALWIATFKLLLHVVTALSVVGFLVGWTGNRFTWPGAHPIVASVYVALALMIMLGFGRSKLRLTLAGFAGRLVLFALALYRGETRGALAGLVVAVAVLLWFAGRRRPLTRYVGLLYYGAAVVLIVGLALPAILGYATRGMSIEGITTLNGRVPLWHESVELLNEADRWALGFGYGAARVILPLHVEWAGTAHSSWIELLFGLGLIGLALGLADTVWLSFQLWRPDSMEPEGLTLGILAFLLIVSIASEILVFPGIGFGLQAMLHAPALADVSRRRSSPVDRAGPVPGPLIARTALRAGGG